MTRRLPPVIVLAFGSAGDVYPMAALALGLQARGHRVQLLCGRLHAQAFRRKGLETIEVETDALPPMQVHRSPLLKSPALWRRVEQAMVAGYRHIESQWRAHPPGAPRPVLLASSFALAGRVAQERLGLRLLSVHLSPLCIASAHAPPRLGDLVTPRWLPLRARQGLWQVLERQLFDPVVTPGPNALRAEAGLPPVRRLLSQWLHSPDGVLALFPAWFAPAMPDWPAALQQPGFPLDPAPESDAEADALATDPGLRDFLAAGPPPVALYPSSARRDASAFFERGLLACERAGRRALLLTRYPEQVRGGRALPAWALHRAHVPFAQVLPRCAALVHVGGIGASAQALRAGLPQLLRPHHFDQFDNADRLHRLGVGRVLRHGATAEATAQALGELLASAEVAAACARWRDTLATAPDGLDRAVEAAARWAVAGD